MIALHASKLLATNNSRRNRITYPAPTASAGFDLAYRLPFAFWGDSRIPNEIKALIQLGTPRSILELGCGAGTFSRYVAQQGLLATGVDFSPAAIAKARERFAQEKVRAQFLREG